LFAFHVSCFSADGRNIGIFGVVRIINCSVLVLSVDAESISVSATPYLHTIFNSLLVVCDKRRLANLGQLFCAATDVMIKASNLHQR